MRLQSYHAGWQHIKISQNPHIERGRGERKERNQIKLKDLHLYSNVRKREDVYTTLSANVCARYRCWTGRFWGGILCQKMHFEY